MICYAIFMHIIAGVYKNRVLSVPKGTLTRPTSSRLREALFNICQGTIEDAFFLDLFAGSGAIGLEALSRGASKAILVDSSKESLKCMNKNVESLNLQKQAKVICGDVFQSLKKLSHSGYQFDIIFADPPYEKKGIFGGELISYSQQLLYILDTLPLLKENGYLYLEDVLPESLISKTFKLISSRTVGKTSLCEFKKLPLISEANQDTNL